jgi:signal transduction histidine kinase
MTAPTLLERRRWPWIAWGLTLAVALARLVIVSSAEESSEDIGELTFALGAIAASATVGALITSRQPRNRVGLLFATLAGAAAVSATAGASSSLGVGRDLPFAAWAAWLSQLGFVVMLGPLAFLFLLYPTGDVPTPRWRWVLRVMLAAYAVNVSLFALTPGAIESGFVDQHDGIMNPLAFPPGWRGLVRPITQAAGVVVFVGAFLGVVSLVLRFRRADPDERQQIRWLAYLAAFLSVFILLAFALEAVGLIPPDAQTVVSNLGFFVIVTGLFFGVPATCAIAILRYRLYDLDVVVRKTVQYGLLVVATLAAFGLLVLGAGVLLVDVPSDLVPGIAIGLVIAALFGFLRPHAQRFANRIVYGTRSTPYEVLSDFAERVGETYSTEDVLPRMAQLLGQATGAREARVWLRVGRAMRAEASWPEATRSIDDVPISHDDVPRFGGDRAFEVRHQGELLGALTVAEAPDDPMTPSKEKLAKDMASQAGLVLRNVRLIEDLRESRRRIVATQDDRAKKLERDIHDGAQQQLVALAVKLGLTERLVGSDPARAASMLRELKGETERALEDLRDLARGIYPPLLADKGLGAALESQARKSTVPVTVETDGIGRYPQEAEAAVYFSCLEALQNVAKYAGASSATVRLEQRGGALAFEVSDDGRGFDPDAAERGSGLQGIADRLAALGGEMTVRSTPGRGTTVGGRVPVVGSSPPSPVVTGTARSTTEGAS